MTDVALGIDIGTSGLRIAAVDRDGVLKASASAPILAPLQSGIRLLQDPAIWLAALHKAFAALDLSNLHVRAVAVDGTSGTILSIDAGGAPQGLASMYNDVAEPEDVSRVAAVASRETAALGATSPLARALPMAGGGRILHQADWLSGQFSGRFDVTDENNALKSGYDPVTRAWPDWIAATGFDPRRFPVVQPAGSAIGTISSETAAKFRLPSDVVIVAGTTDGCAAFLASGADTPGDGVTSLGTTLTIKLLSAKPVFAPQYGIYSHRIGEQWLAGGASNSGGAAIAKYFDKDAIARLTPLLMPDQPTGLDYYPLPGVGERFPINDAEMLPRLEPRPADERVFFQAILEGVAVVESLGYRRLAELGASPLASIRTVGGGATNAAWASMRNRALAVPPKPVRSEQAAYGTALLAWRGV